MQLVFIGGMLDVFNRRVVWYSAIAASASLSSYMNNLHNHIHQQKLLTRTAFLFSSWTRFSRRLQKRVACSTDLSNFFLFVRLGNHWFYKLLVRCNFSAQFLLKRPYRKLATDSYFLIWISWNQIRWCRLRGWISVTIEITCKALNC